VLAHTRWKLLQRLEVDYKVVLDSEHGIGREPWVVLWIDLCYYGLVVGMRDLGLIRLRSTKQLL
jgi:hypothetical protein